MELQRNLDAIRRGGLGLAAISYDAPDVLRAFADKYGIQYPLLSDAGSATIGRYGILNAAATGAAAGIPHPGTFVVDSKGRVVARFFEAAYQERYTAATILAALERPDDSGRKTTSVRTPHVEIRTSASDEVVAPGERFGLVIDVAPKPTMRVYAPGQTGYIPVSLALEPDGDYTAHPIAFPPAEDYLFAPLNERVKVYGKPFRLVQELTVSLSRELRERAAAGATLTIRGTLRYQACDDKMCYVPAQAPLEWTVKLKRLETPERR